MPRVVTVREVREALFRAAVDKGADGNGAPSNLLLGQWFHTLFAQLLGSDDRLNWRAAVSGVQPTVELWEARLRDHAYQSVAGPLIGRHHAHLQEKTEQLLSFWQAAGGLCHWLAELLIASEWEGQPLRVAPEQKLTLELREPGWADAVVVTGAADAMLQRPVDRQWCVVELKLGRSFPEADLGQACLYHMIVNAAGGRGPLALVSFQPQQNEKVFSPEELAPAIPKLKALIGRLAGLLPEDGVGSPAQTPAVVSTDAPATEAAASQYNELSSSLLKVFEEYDTPVKLSSAPLVGPAFIRFTVELLKGVKMKAVEQLDRDIQQRLKLEALPFIHLSRGRVVVDLQRPDRQTVLFSSVTSQLPKPDSSAGSARVPVGVELDGRLHYADLADPSTAHILVAGTTGSGKSEWLRTAIAGLLAANTPATLRLVLIDPKRNAFGDLKASPFLLDDCALVYPDDRDTSEVLDVLIEEMETRYRTLEREKAGRVGELDHKTRQPLPRIVCVCDEYADLIGQGRQARREIEARICRLGSKARAAGIHLILATQHPSREIIKGALDSNMPCRVAMKMTKSIESNMLLGEPGAENLLGLGDLLFKNIGSPRRLQTPYVPPEERAKWLGVS
jgi:DNA segregation ATPase FtsK/SpoIIIE, S-DNA-T family